MIPKLCIDTVCKRGLNPNYHFFIAKIPIQDNFVIFDDGNNIGVVHDEVIYTTNTNHY